MMKRPFIKHPAMKRLAMVSMHSSPLAALGGSETGGMNVYVREISRNLGRHGWHVDIFTRRQDSATPLIQPLSERVRVINVEAGPARRCEKTRLQGYVEPFAKRLIAFADREGLNYDLIHGHYWLSGLVALSLRRRWPVPFVQMFHTLAALKNHVADATGEREPLERQRGEHQVMAEADLIIAATHAEKAQISWFYGVAPERIRVIPCGVDVTRFSPKYIATQPPVTLPGKQNILFVGRLERIKGIEVLIRAVAELSKDAEPANGKEAGENLPRKRPHLVLIGGESETKRASRNGEKNRLARLAASLGIADQLSFLGPQAQEILPIYYAAADVVVMPSYYESFGLVALEAMACATPVIASKVGGLPHAIEDAATGYLVPAGNVAQLTARLGKLLGDEQLRRCFGLRGAMSVRKFSWPKIVQQLLSTYAALLEGQPQESLEWTVP